MPHARIGSSRNPNRSEALKPLASPLEKLAEECDQGPNDLNCALHSTTRQSFARGPYGVASGIVSCLRRRLGEDSAQACLFPHTRRADRRTALGGCLFLPRGLIALGVVLVAVRLPNQRQFAAIVEIRFCRISHGPSTGVDGQICCCDRFPLGAFGHDCLLQRAVSLTRRPDKGLKNSQCSSRSFCSSQGPGGLIRTSWLRWPHKVYAK